MANLLSFHAWEKEAAPLSMNRHSLKASVTGHWGKTALWLLWTIFSSLLPILGGLTVLLLIGEPGRVEILVEKGQLALAAAALVGAAIYVSSLDREPPGMRHRSLLLLGSVLVLFLAALIYAVVQTVDLLQERLGSSSDVIRTDFLIAGSLLVYVVSLGLAFWVTLIDTERLDNNYEQLTEHYQDELIREFRDLGISGDE